jgi:hypothetical protein
VSRCLNALLGVVVQNVVMLNVVVLNVVAPIEISEIIEAQWGPIKANHNLGKSYNFVQLGFCRE